MNRIFENKIAVVTGTGGTLCSEIAIQLSLEGAKVFLVGRTVEKLTRVAEKIASLGGVSAVVCPCDVTNNDEVANLAKRVAVAGGCDYLINGAGGNDIKAMPTITKFDERELTGELPEGQRGLLTEWINTDPRGEKYRYLDWSEEYDLARNGDPNDTQTML